MNDMLICSLDDLSQTGVIVNTSFTKTKPWPEPQRVKVKCSFWIKVEMEAGWDLVKNETS